VERALFHDARDVDSLINLHRLIHDNVVELPPLRLSPDIPCLERVNPDFGTYDKALHVGGEGKC